MRFPIRLQSLPCVRRNDDGGTRWSSDRIDPGEPLDKDIYDLSPRGAKGRSHVAPVPGQSFSTRSEADHEFMLKGDVFTETLIERWINYKRTKEVGSDSNAATPLEFQMYFDV